LARSLLRSIKDKTASSALGMAVNHYLGRYGSMKKIIIDSDRKAITLELELKGEREPILVVVEEYEIVSQGGSTYLVAGRISTSREWLTVLAESLLQGRKLPLPDKIPDNLLRLVL